MKIFSLLLILLCSRLTLSVYDQLISAAKISLFIWLDADNDYQKNLPSLTKSYTFTFPKPFAVSPQIALGLYTLDSDYSVHFSVFYEDVNTINMKVWVSKLTSNALNQIYIMYFGTDLPNFQCALLHYDTVNLSSPNTGPNNGSNRSKRSETVTTYNFNQNRDPLDTYMTIFLSGLHIAGELTSSGFQYNYTDFNFIAKPVSTLNFNFTITTSGQVTIYRIEFFYIAYQKNKIEAQGRFILDSGVVYTSNYGGVVSQANTPAQLPLLTKSNYTIAETLFFGLNDLTCQNSVMRILGVEQVFGAQQNLGYVLLMQTWQYTYVINAGFSYLQVKKIICNLDPYLQSGVISCPGVCPNFNYLVNNTNIAGTVCYPCHFSCQTCDNGLTCLTCPSTRNFTNTTCVCRPGYYQVITLECIKCPDQCLTCQSPTICLSCNNSLFRFLDTTSRFCQCQYGYTSPSGAISCVACIEGCASCRLNGTCAACIFGYFLVNETLCAMICNRYQIYDFNTNRCLPYTGNTNVYPPGRFTFDWTSEVSGNNVLIDLVFSNPNALYYYYQGGNGYNINGSNKLGNGSGVGVGAYNQGLYYDDGNGYSFGYSSSTTTTSTTTNPDGTTTTTTTTTSSGSYPTQYANNNQALIAAMHGAYGANLPSNITLANYSAVNFNPFTLGALSSYYYPLNGQINTYRLSGEPPEASYLGAITANLQVRINGQLVPFTVRPTTQQNHFIIVASPTRTYANAQVTVNIKDPALIVSNSTVAIQTTNLTMYDSSSYYATLYGANYNNMINQSSSTQTYFDNSNMYGNGTIYYLNGTYYFANGTIAPSYLVGNSIDTLNYYIAAGSPVGALVCYSAYTPAQITSADNLAHTNRFVSEALWGVSKIFLFLGFGWQVMPIMMSMQYIFAHFYITTNTPYNLRVWLGSWNDYRNPSIFFHKVRNNMDEVIFPDTNAVYSNIPAYNIYDRGIDFMKNNFQFFLTVAMSFFCLGILYLISSILVCTRGIEINFISNYLAQRKMLHFASYMLIWSLPFSWFFWGQITDTYSRHGRYYNYSNWNLGMTFLVFFMLVIFPAFIMYWVYYGFNYQRVFRFDKDIQIAHFLNNNVANRIDQRHMVGLGDPLWSGLQTSKMGYLWASMVYYRFILFGFWTSFFYGNGTNQLIGIIATNIAFLIFTAFGYWFTNPCYKWYFLIETALLIAYQILAGAINSGTYCANTGVFFGAGYAGIGILYGLFGLGALFSLYALYQSFMRLYSGYFSKGNFFVPFGQVNANPYLTAPRGMPLEGRKTTLLDSRRMTNRMNTQFNQRRTNILPGGSFADMHSERHLVEYVPPPPPAMPIVQTTTTHKRTQIIPGKVVNLGQQIHYEQKQFVQNSGYTYLKIFFDSADKLILVDVSGKVTKRITLVDPSQYIRQRIRMAREVYIDSSGQIFCDGELLNMQYQLDKKIIKSSTHIENTNINREGFYFQSQIQNPHRLVLASNFDNERLAVIQGTQQLYAALRAGRSIEIDTNNNLYIDGMLYPAYIILLQRYELSTLNPRSHVVSAVQSQSGMFRVEYLRSQGDDIILRKVGAKAIIRLQDIQDYDLIQQLKNPNNVITSDGTLIFINNRNIFQNAQSIRATRRLITNRFVESEVGPGVVSPIVPIIQNQEIRRSFVRESERFDI